MKNTHICRQFRMIAPCWASALLLLAACDQPGSAEKAGQNIDQAAEKVSKNLENTKSTVIQKADTASAFLDDSMITAKVKEILFSDDLLKASQIEVETHDGEVNLHGTLASELLVNRAVELIKTQKYVKSVRNDLNYTTNTEIE